MLEQTLSMIVSMAMTVLGPDRPGLVKLLSNAVAENGANWIESRMARLAGQFAGIVRVECPEQSCDSLIAAFNQFAAQGIAIQTIREEIRPPKDDQYTLSIDVVANDRPGIVRELASAITTAGGNIEDFTTGLESAAMSGQSLFRARGIVSLPNSADSAKLVLAIEKLGGDLSVEIV